VNRLILAGDIGGTKCNLAAFEEHGGTLEVIFQNRFATQDFSSFEQLIETFLTQSIPARDAIAAQRITAAGFGVAGTVVDGHLHAINLPWELNAEGLARTLNLNVHDIVFMNDVAATASGLDQLPREDFLVLNEGIQRPDANKALIAPGTGLGEAILFWDGRRHRVSPSEGGAADFAPRTDREIALLKYLKQSLPRVTCEEVFSGRGFQRIHHFLDSNACHSPASGAACDSARAITQNALAGTCPVCVETLDFWIDAFGAEAGNFALRVLAYGGIYLAGGIVLKIPGKLQRSSFCESFADKFPLGPVLARMPISVVLNENAPVLGAAYEALRTVRPHLQNRAQGCHAD
jgi:glucokinase